MIESLRRLDAAIDEDVDYRPLVPLRVAIGPIVLLHLAPYLADSLQGRTYQDVFTVPFFSWWPQLPEQVYVAALWLTAAAGVLISLGLWTKLATRAAALFVVYHLLLSQTHYHHNRAFLAAVLIGLALMPVGERWSLDARLGRTGRARPGWGPRWPLMLVRLQIATVYLASGLSKLVDSDWFGGTVLRLRVEREAAAAIADGVPEWIVDLAASASFQGWFSKVVVLTELLIGAGLLVPRLRPAAIWLAVAFHIAIEVTADVQVFSYVAIAALVVWVRPTPPDRVLVAPPGRAGLVRALDWTSRFTHAGSGGWALTEPDGSRHEGSKALWRVLTLLPLTFWPAAPIGIVRCRAGPVGAGSGDR